MRKPWDCGATRLLAVVLAAGGLLCASHARAQPQPQPTEPRLAFIAGTGSYLKGQLPTALNDAGLVAEALRTIGFEIYEVADGRQEELSQHYRDFTSRVAAAGPSAIAFVYVSGLGFTYDGENYLVAAGARLERTTDIPLDTIRLGELVRPLAALPARGRIVVLDAARLFPFSIEGVRPAPGLGPIEAPQGMLIAMASAPGTFAQDGQGPYGPYATALAEMLRAPGLDLSEAFTRVRERTLQLTHGAQIPWHVSALGPLALVPADSAAGAARAFPPLRAARPLREIGAEQAYAYAIEQDTLPAYVDFVQAYARHPYAARIWAIIRARREVLTWQRALQLNTPQAYWTYQRRYPDGIYAGDAERRLRRLSAALAPAQDFVPIEFAGVPRPLPNEPSTYVGVYPPGPPPPAALLPPAPRLYANLAPPTARPGSRLLPTPAALPAVAHIQPGGRRALAASESGAPVQPPRPQSPALAPAPAPSRTGAPAAAAPGSTTAHRRPAPNAHPAVAPAKPAPRSLRPPGAKPAATGAPAGAAPPASAAPAAAVPPAPPPVAVNRPAAPRALTRPAPPARPAPPRPPRPAVIARPPAQPSSATPSPAGAGQQPRNCTVVNGQQVCR